MGDPAQRMKMIRVAHMRTSVRLSGERVVVEDYGEWLPISQVAAFKSGYTHVDAPSSTLEQSVTSLVWVASIETLDGTIHEAPNPEVAREWHREILGVDPGVPPELPAHGSAVFQKADMVIEKWPQD
jgi:hypothetical protein